MEERLRKRYELERIRNNKITEPQQKAHEQSVTLNLIRMNAESLMRIIERIHDELADEMWDKAQELEKENEVLEEKKRQLFAIYEVVNELGFKKRLRRMKHQREQNNEGRSGKD